MPGKEAQDIEAKAKAEGCDCLLSPLGQCAVWEVSTNSTRLETLCEASSTSLSASTGSPTLSRTLLDLISHDDSPYSAIPRGPWLLCAIPPDKALDQCTRGRLLIYNQDTALSDMTQDLSLGVISPLSAAQLHLPFTVSLNACPVRKSPC